MTRSVVGLAMMVFCVCLICWACTDPENTQPPTSDGTRPIDIETEFRDACRSMISLPALVPSVRDLVVGRQGWILLVSELRYLFYQQRWLSNPPPTEDDIPLQTGVDPLTAILHFNRELEMKGITLVVVPVPVRPLVYPESVIDPSRFERFPRLPDFAAWQSVFFDHLESSECLAVDLAPTFIDNRASDRGPVFLATESHWTGIGMVAAAKEISASIKRQAWYRTAKIAGFDQVWTNVEIPGDLSQRFVDVLQSVDVVPAGLNTVKLGPVKMPVRRVVFDREGLTVPVEIRNPDSPIVVIGDSYVGFGADSNYGIGQQLAVELGIAVDVLATSGGGANAARMNLIRAAMSDPTYLDGKKCVVWVFAARDMVGVEWIPLPFSP